MIKDKVIEYWQTQHPQEWEAMQEEFNEYWRETSRLYTDKGGIDSAEPLAGYFIFEFTENEDSDTAHRAYFHKDELLHTYYFESAGGIIADQYIDSFKDQPERIYNDVHEILDALDKDDYKKHLEEVNDDYSARHYMSRAIIRHNKDGKYIYTLEPTERNKPKRLQLFTENYTSCVSFLLAVLRVQSEVVDKYLGGDAHFIEIIEAKAREWYPETAPAHAKPNYLPMAHGTPTDEFRFMTSKGVELDRAKNLVVRRGNVTLKISEFGSIGTALGISTDKLLSTAIMGFTSNNDFRTARPDTINRTVKIDFNEYARALGYDIDLHSTSTPEAEAKEKKRVRNVRDNALKAIRKDLAILRACDISWTEYTHGKNITPPQFFDQPIIGGRGYIDGNIIITFDADFAQYLVNRNFITYYPTELLKLDARKPNAYYLGRKLASHYYMSNNRTKGTYNRLQVKKLLDVTELPTYEELKSKGIARKWEERIKTRLEEGLEDLYKIGVLESWTYCHEKDKELTDDEKYNILSYDDFESLYIRFELKDAVTPT